ncbi:MAG: hypothetical protein CMJ76_00670 [Planctomycetaceae bacterium]|nr:hypothetical protein [Planctomycetaceae bacterium]
MSKAAGFFVALMLLVAGGLMLFKLSSGGQHQSGTSAVTGAPDWQPKISPADYETGAGELWITEFELVDQQGESFSSAEMEGKVWLASFFFASCPATCVQQNREKQSLHEVWSRKGVKFVSITCDAENDTPARLHEYSQKFTTDHENWKFLSGDGGFINRIGSEFFRVSVGPRTHTDSFVLMDKWGNVRGTYNWLDKTELKQMNQEIVTLLTEDSEPQQWTEKRKQLEAQIAQFAEQQKNSEEQKENSSDITDSSESTGDGESINETE